MRGSHSVGIFLLIAEMQRVGDGFWHIHFNKDATVKQSFHARARADAHMVIAMGADVQILRQLAVKQHRAAFGAFGPKIFGNFAA